MLLRGWAAAIRGRSLLAVAAAAINVLLTSAVRISEQFATKDSFATGDNKRTNDLTKGHPECAGQRQSPIDLVTRFVHEDLSNRDGQGALENSVGYEDTHGFSTLRNTGSGLELRGDFGHLEMPFGQFALEHIQFHFPSEHSVDGKLKAGEVQLIHTRVGSTANAESGDRDDGVVISILLQRGDNAKEIGFFSKLGFDGDLPRQGQKKVIQDFLDFNMFASPLAGDVFHYSGSQTTPPCKEGVHWYVLMKPASISANQIKSFKDLFDSVANNRPVQPINGRPLVRNSLVLLDDVMRTKFPNGKIRNFPVSLIAINGSNASQRVNSSKSNGTILGLSEIVEQSKSLDRQEDTDYVEEPEDEQISAQAVHALLESKANYSNVHKKPSRIEDKDKLSIIASDSDASADVLPALLETNVTDGNVQKNPRDPDDQVRRTSSVSHPNVSVDAVPALLGSKAKARNVHANLSADGKVRRNRSASDPNISVGVVSALLESKGNNRNVHEKLGESDDKIKHNSSASDPNVTVGAVPALLESKANASKVHEKSGDSDGKIKHTTSASDLNMSVGAVSALLESKGNKRKVHDNLGDKIEHNSSASVPNISVGVVPALLKSKANVSNVHENLDDSDGKLKHNSSASDPKVSADAVPALLESKANASKVHEKSGDSDGKIKHTTSVTDLNISVGVVSALLESKGNKNYVHENLGDKTKHNSSASDPNISVDVVPALLESKANESNVHEDLDDSDGKIKHNRSASDPNVSADAVPALLESKANASKVHEKSGDSDGQIKNSSASDPKRKVDSEEEGRASGDGDNADTPVALMESATEDGRGNTTQSDDGGSVGSSTDGASESQNDYEEGTDDASGVDDAGHEVRNDSSAVGLIAEDIEKNTDDDTKDDTGSSDSSEESQSEDEVE